jgi:hypothetical protein
MERELDTPRERKHPSFRKAFCPFLSRQGKQQFKEGNHQKKKEREHGRLIRADSRAVVCLWWVWVGLVRLPSSHGIHPDRPCAEANTVAVAWRRVRRGGFARRRAQSLSLHQY